MPKPLREQTKPAASAGRSRQQVGLGELESSIAPSALLSDSISWPAANPALTRTAEHIAASVLVRAIDPALVVPSKWGNRHKSSFDQEGFRSLKEEIRLAGGNVQPVKVRPVRADVVLPRSTLRHKHPHEYEIVYGHRRHRACLELGLPVLAHVEDMSDVELFAQMDRENRNRADLSPWEQGMMYLRALESELFPSMRQLAKAVGCDPATISRALSLAQLPSEVVDAFQSPIDLQFRWAKPLIDALEQDRDAVVERARGLKDHSKSPTAIFEELVRAPPDPQTEANFGPSTLCHAGKRIGEVIRDARQRTVVRFHRPLTPPEHSEVVQAIQQVFTKR